MSSLAHEGNPKEDQIIIAAGDVLSTAQLDIDFLFFGGAPNIPSIANPNLTHESSTCADVFEWVDEQQGVPPWTLRDYYDTVGGSRTLLTTGR